eukprot:3748258-Rhodomonas_salina.1
MRGERGEGRGERGEGREEEERRLGSRVLRFESASARRVLKRGGWRVSRPEGAAGAYYDESQYLKGPGRDSRAESGERRVERLGLDRERGAWRVKSQTLSEESD